MIDQRSSLNIISLPILDAVCVSRDNITRQPIEVLRFGGNYMYALGFVKLNLIVGPIRVVHRYHVIDSRRPTIYCSNYP